MNRGISVLLTTTGTSAVLMLSCLGLIGGQVGMGLLFVLLAIIARQVLIMLIARRSFTLDGMPLPTLLYFVPAPPAGRHGVGPYGLAALVTLGIVAFGIGFDFGPGPMVEPLKMGWRTGASLAVVGAVLGLLFAIVILISETRFEEPRPVDPPLTFIMLGLALFLWLGVAALRSPVLYDGHYIVGWRVRFVECKGERDLRTRCLRVELTGPRSEVVFSRGAGVGITVDFKAVSLALSEASEKDGLELGLTPMSDEGAPAPTHYVSLAGLDAHPRDGLLHISVPVENFALAEKTVTDLRFRGAANGLPVVMELRRLAIPIDKERPSDGNH